MTRAATARSEPAAARGAAGGGMQHNTARRGRSLGRIAAWAVAPLLTRRALLDGVKPVDRGRDDDVVGRDVLGVGCHPAARIAETSVSSSGKAVRRTPHRARVSGHKLSGLSSRVPEISQGGREVREVFVVRDAKRRTETTQARTVAARLENQKFSPRGPSRPPILPVNLAGSSPRAIRMEAAPDGVGRRDRGTTREFLQKGCG